MTFSNITDLVIPEGNVIRIQNSLGGVLWEKQSAGEIPEWYGASADTDFSQRFMEYVPLGDGTLNLQNSQYSFDGINWLGGGTINVTKYVPFFIKGDKSYSAISGHTFDFYVRGNIALSFPARSIFQKWYKDNSRIIGSKYLIIDCNITPWRDYVFTQFFLNCVNMKTSPEILPVTPLQGARCYENMFQFCTSLTNIPILPVNTLTNQCYYQMFDGCTSLTGKAILPATSIYHINCYTNMFKNCHNINYIKMLAIDNVDEQGNDLYFTDWTLNVSPTGIFVKHIDSTWNRRGTDGIPSGWTIIYYDPSTDRYWTDQQKNQECDENGNPI